MKEKFVQNKVQLLAIDENSNEQRIDNYLIKLLKGVPKSLIYRLIRKGQVRVNKKRIKQDYRLQLGDLVRIPPVRVSDKPKPAYVGNKIQTLLENNIIHEDEGIIILNKPAGFAVHGGSGVSLGVIEAFRQVRPELRYLELVHRLDRDTSGCLILAKKRSFLRKLHEVMREQQAVKCYSAILKGQWRGEKVKSVREPLKKNVLASGERIVRVDPEGKASHSEFKLKQQFKDCCLVDIRIFTGRTHQIRVHAAHLKMPVAGDVKYGDDTFNQTIKRMGCNRLCLHAREITIPNFSEEEAAKNLTVEAPFDKLWLDLLKQLRI